MTGLEMQAGFPPWHPHWDVWALVLLLGGGYWYATTRLRPVDEEVDTVAAKKKALAFGVGVLVLWFVSDWPFNDLAEERLFFLHTIEHLALGLVVPPLLLVGTPAWLLRKVFANRFTIRVFRPLAQPASAFFLFTVIFAGMHWPQVITLMVTVPLAHFLLHALLITAAFITWLPVFSPIPEIPRMKPGTRMLYLAAHSLLPTVPASFLTFGRTPIYRVYEQAPRIWGIDALTDQALAGLVVKLGGGAVLWGMITVMWFRWYADEKRWDRIEQDLRNVQ